ncbi:MAG: T9SS type A sorting domain-containing protein [Candidatus Hatepunaea meridiana]|nr:T9SS type A sorting domain-containing protein [Candidatus Hatepunaea meridiana]
MKSKKLDKQKSNLIPIKTFLWGISFLLIIALPFSLMGQTEVEGEVSGEWTAEDSPYIVIDSTWVPEDEELLIEPGVEIRFNAGIGLEIFGSIEAEGTEEDTIFFRSVEEDELWRGLCFYGSDVENNFEYCSVRDVEIAFGFEVASTLTVDHCIIIAHERCFENLYGLGIRSFSVFVDNSRLLAIGGRNAVVSIESYRFISSNSEFIRLEDDEGNFPCCIYNDGYLELDGCYVEGEVSVGGITTMRVTDCEFYPSDDQSRFYLSNYGFIRNSDVYCNFYSGYSYDFLIEDCYISGDMISLDEFGGRIVGTTMEGDRLNSTSSHEMSIIDCNLEFERISFVADFNLSFINCRINSRFQFRGSYNNADGRIGDLTIENCIMISEFNILSLREANLINNTIIMPETRHQNFLSLFEFWGVDRYSDITIQNNIIFAREHEEATSLLDLRDWSGNENYPDVRYNCIYDFDYVLSALDRRQDTPFVLDSVANIFTNPLFVSLDSLDLHLQEESPCIDAGNPDSPRDPDGTRADMGAYYFHQGNYIRPFDNISANELRILSLYPNPFNSMTNISFNLQDDSHIKLTIHDLQGREVSLLYEGQESAGVHSLSWDATGLAAGVYICRLQSDSKAATIKLVMVR